MIVRIWHGRTKSKDAIAYREFVIETGIKDYTSSNGILGAQILQRQEGDITHIWTVSWWKDIESIKVVAGNEIEKAKCYVEDKKYLLEFEPNAMHFETFNFKAPVQ